MDTRGSHFYLAMYWAQALTEQTEAPEMQAQFAPMTKSLIENEQQIIEELNAVQDETVDIGGYYNADPEKVKAVMRPNATFNRY